MILWLLLPCGHGVSPSGEIWDACAACDFASPASDDPFALAALRALGSPSGEIWDACAACSKAGPVMGLRPLLGPPCIPPEAPPKRGFQLSEDGEGTRLMLRELPSLATLTQVISLRDA